MTRGYIFGLLTLLLFNVQGLVSQSQGYLYGKVTLKSGQVYQGQLRWEDREAMWNDIFDAYKADPPYRNLLSREESEQLRSAGEDFKFGFMELWEDRNPGQGFIFRCYFGDIVMLEKKPKERVLLTLKNGQSLSLKEDGGDLGDDIVVVDRSNETRKFSFSNITSIEFEKTPPNFRSIMGEPVYGKVLTSNGVYEGYITWDREECLGNDIITGRQREQKFDLRFKDIAEIMAERDGSKITLKSGKSLFLNDHDDVNSGNHGIAIRGLPFGVVELGWENFISVRFFDPVKPAAGYDDFGSPKLLEATIRTNIGAKTSSQIVYDLDEIYDIEFLNGSNGGFSYFIPFSQVVKIEPQNDKFSAVTVKSGEQFVLGESGDVNRRNNGLILKFSENSAKFLKWEEVKSLHFD